MLLLGDETDAVTFPRLTRPIVGFNKFWADFGTVSAHCILEPVEQDLSYFRPRAPKELADRCVAHVGGVMGLIHHLAEPEHYHCVDVSLSVRLGLIVPLLPECLHLTFFYLFGVILHA